MLSRYWNVFCSGSVMKNLLPFLLMTSISFGACGQNKTSLDDVKAKWLSIHNQVGNQNTADNIYIDISSTDCTFQILINDVPALISNEEGNINGAVLPVSDLIPASGVQHYTIKIFPKVDVAYKPDKQLSKTSGVTLKIYQGNGKDKGEELLSFTSPEVGDESKAEISFKGTFKANVPYQLNGWKDGVLLTNEDPEKLKKEVFAFYEKLRKAYETHDIAFIGDALYNRQIESAKAYHAGTPERSTANFAKLEQLNDITGMYPIERDSLAFFGNGKMVALIRTDPEFRGKSVIIGETEDLISVLPVYLYRPKPGAPLAVIR